MLCCRLLGSARRFGDHGGGEGRRHIVAAARLQLVDHALLHVDQQGVQTLFQFANILYSRTGKRGLVTM